MRGRWVWSLVAVLAGCLASPGETPEGAWTPSSTVAPGLDSVEQADFAVTLRDIQDDARDGVPFNVTVVLEGPEAVPQDPSDPAATNYVWVEYEVAPGRYRPCGTVANGDFPGVFEVTCKLRASATPYSIVGKARHGNPPPGEGPRWQSEPYPVTVG